MLIQWRGSHRNVMRARAEKRLTRNDQSSAPTFNDASSHILFSLETEDPALKIILREGTGHETRETGEHNPWLQLAGHDGRSVGCGQHISI